MSMDLVSITTVSERLGVPISTLRYWEERGLISATGRQAGRRCYAWQEIQRIVWIQILQETGLLSLEEIAQVLRGHGGKRHWHEVLHARMASIDEQMRKLRQARSLLEHLVTCPSDQPDKECQVLGKDALERWRLQHMRSQSGVGAGDHDALHAQADALLAAFRPGSASGVS